MRRRLSNLLTALSLLLCAAVVVLWVRSYFVRDFVNYSRIKPYERDLRGPDLTAVTDAGLVELQLVQRHFAAVDEGSAADVPLPEQGWHWKTNAAERPFVRTVFGFGYESFWSHPDFTAFNAAFPLWAPAALFAARPAIWLYRRVRRHPYPGCCPHCGYDLRATPGRCPECGAEPAAAGSG
jgi:hypothetical protein